FIALVGFSSIECGIVFAETAQGPTVLRFNAALSRIAPSPQVDEFAAPPLHAARSVIPVADLGFFLREFEQGWVGRWPRSVGSGPPIRILAMGESLQWQFQEEGWVGNRRGSMTLTALGKDIQGILSGGNWRALDR